MCELKVYLKQNTGEEGTIIARGIVAAKVQEKNVIIMDVMGTSQIIEDVIIESVSTMKQEIILKKNS